MADCRLCGAPAGFLRWKHKACKLKHRDAKNNIRELVENKGVTGGDLKLLEQEIVYHSEEGYVDMDTATQLMITGWENAVERAFEDEILSESEQTNLTNLADYFEMSPAALDKKGAHTRMVKGAVIRNILEGRIPEELIDLGTHPFNLQKSEKLIWIFQDTNYYEQKKKTKYVGGSSGVSVRVAKGVYFRTGGFKGKRVETTETVHVGKGLLGVTNKHIYFFGKGKSFRIKHEKIVSFEPFSDGIGVQQDKASAKPQSFITGDGWFTYNLIANAAQL
ncbi:hypothetical protein [Vibrio rarus]|uniref:hypothetical protein n=1 Tax=Vibrio rarus TaxID=413403 RepID=UPI0021C39FDD|nr:hypothetical protein [Vibrio rarus]